MNLRKHFVKDIQKNLVHPTSLKASDFRSYKTKSFLTMFNNKELTTALHKMLVCPDRIIADYRGRINQILLYLVFNEDYSVLHCPKNSITYTVML
jgi:hypothetical protein